MSQDTAVPEQTSVTASADEPAPAPASAPTAAQAEQAETDAEASSEVPAEWSIEDYHAALAHLDNLQEKLTSLRSAIPTIASPLRSPPSNKPKLFATIKDVGAQVGGNLEVFVAGWRDAETQRLLERGRESMRKDGNLSKADEVERWGWNG